MYYVVVDIGCLCCDVGTLVVGIFTDKDKAKRAAESIPSGARDYGKHSVEVFEVEKITAADASRI